MPSPYVLDTNTIICILRREPRAVGGLRMAAERDAPVYLCPVVYFEVTRGFVITPDVEQERVFHSMKEALEWDDLSERDWDKAASLWAECRQRGRRPKDADILIAAYALNRDATVVTDDVGHFENIGLVIENWRQSEDSSSPRAQR